MAPESDVDVIVIGSGINGLVAAAELAMSGRTVAILERNAELGGFIASGTHTVPGFLHDTYSSWHPMFVSSPAYGALGTALHEHGLEYANTDDLVTASVGDDGRVAVAHRDPVRTAASMEVESDRRAYGEMLEVLGRRAGVVFGALGAELAPTTLGRLAVSSMRQLRVTGSAELLRDGVSSGLAYLHRHFAGWETDRLWSPWLLHAGLSPAGASGGVMLPVMAATMHQFGLPVVRGGAGQFVVAFRQILEKHQVRIETNCAAERIVAVDGRATAVHTSTGETLRAREAVIAGVAPGKLYRELLDEEAAGIENRSSADTYRPGRAAMQIHVALDGRPRWNDSRLDRVPLVHITDGGTATALSCAQAEAGFLPDRPTVVVGQQYVLDPSRVPDGGAALWIQLQELPYRPYGDTADELTADGRWTAELAERYAHRVLERIGRHANGIGGQILGLHVISPVDIERYNPNAVDGDPYCGSAELDQNLVWRPFPGGARHATTIPGLWHIGAATHPGPGLGGGSGHLAAQQIILGERQTFRRRRRAR